MKEIYMLCNAHLDPVWLWQRQEGMAEAISTFRVAADFCEKYEGFIFNHNESVLYEWVEEYEPALFKRIQKLVKEGKWRIMGGWYLQPDCMMPSGESFLRQIETGNRYFQEKFGIVPKTAVNFDPFGHTRGLVQILAKRGYENYLFVRPLGMIPEQNFIWRGYDGSEVLGHNVYGTYNSPKGRVLERVIDMQNNLNDRCLLCWGIGDHGGGPSEEDWKALCEYQTDHPEVKMLTVGCEEYFGGVEKESLRVVAESLVHCMVGCYTSMVRIKQKHRQLENELLICEKMLAASEVSYDEKEMQKAEKALLFSEFHDSLPGTMVKKAEEDMLRQMDYGREILAQNCAKAFFKICEGQKAGKRGEIPVLVFNPNPYRITQEVEVEFQLEEQNFNVPEVTLAKVRTLNGTYLPAQNIKEDCTFNLDWRKRIVFRAELEPMSLNRFDCELYTISEPRRPIVACQETETHFLFENERMQAAVSKQTGLIDRYCVDGIDYLKTQSAKIRVYEDNEDPWRMQVDGFYQACGEFTLVKKEQANAWNGYPKETMENVRIIENGEVITRLQAIFQYSRSYAVVTYTFYKLDTYMDIKVKLYSNDVNRMYKLEFPTTFTQSRYEGQQAFGREELLQEEKEVCYQKWCGLFEKEKGFAVLNRGTYGGSSKDQILKLSLLRTPVYSAHPIYDRQIAETDRNHEHIDLGEREFEYRITTEVDHLDAQAEIYNQPVYALSFFPSGEGNRRETGVELTNPAFVLTRYSRNAEGSLLRIYNGEKKEQTGMVLIEEQAFEVTLPAYTFRTYRWEKGSFVGVEETREVEAQCCRQNVNWKKE